MKGAPTRVLAVVLSCLMLLPACGSTKGIPFFEDLAESVVGHGHARAAIVDKHGEGLYKLSLLLLAALRWTSVEPPDGAMRSGSWSAGGFEPVADRAVFPQGSLGDFGARGSNGYFDRDLDGAWIVRSYISSDVGYGELPYIVLANGGDGWGYLSVVFQRTIDCVNTGKADWSHFYTGEVSHGPTAAEYRFDEFSSRPLADFFPNVPKVEMDYVARPSNNERWFGAGTVSELGAKKPLFTTQDEFHRMGKPTDAGGLWSGGLMARLYAGEFLDPPFFHPVNLVLVQAGTRWRGAMYVLLGNQPFLDPRIDGDEVSFEFPTANGQVDGELSLDGGVLKGRVFDPLTSEYKELTLKRAGSMPRKPKLKRIKPKAAPFSTVGREVTLVVKAKNLAPGAMIYFSEPDIRINSIQYVSKKLMRVTVEAVRAIQRGTKVDVMVLNPDNRSAEKARAIRVK